MKKLIFTFFLAFGISHAFAQQSLIDSLKHQLAITTQDTSRVLILSELCYRSRLSNPDSSMLYGQKALSLARQIKFLRGMSSSLHNLGQTYRELGNLPMAVNLTLQALRIAETNHYQKEEAFSRRNLGNVYYDLKKFPLAIQYHKQALVIYEKLHQEKEIPAMYLNIGVAYLQANQLDSASYYLKLSYHGSITQNLIRTRSLSFRNLGILSEKLGNYQLAKTYFNEAITLSTQENDHRNVSMAFSRLAEFYKNRNQPDSCIYYALKGLSEAKIGLFPARILEASILLAEAYKIKGDFKKAYEFQELMIKTKEGLYGAGSIQAMQDIINDEQERQNKIESEKIAYQNQIKQFALLAGLGVFLLIGFILYRNNQNQRKANKLLNQQKTEIRLQKEKVEKALLELKSTQAQLIQKEKLASLGELTAGIAHEIQNPLNFVNNFSELSVDLVKDLKEEIEKTTQDKAYIGELFDDLSSNQEKINTHGKRASSIVSGMLEHSRTSTGERVLTDINKLADEYLRLSFHGMRAKNSSFNADYELIADSTLPLINVVPQDIGRVLLNLINNAFYAVHQRNNVETLHATSLPAQTKYQPTVTISTKQANNQIIISVSDNGAGIPENIKEKIFQPFFTTKPTGQGTGLGLSLAYDIITKGHGGTIQVDSVEGQGTTFIIKLPLQV